jgi:putative acetyltransferase
MSELRIRPIGPGDREAVAAIIRAVMPEFGASGPGFAINDPEVSDIPSAYAKPRSAFFVVVDEDRVVGGGGVAPLEGGDGSTCELKKMYFLPEARGRGMGAALLTRCLEAARDLGYRRVYLETLGSMTSAQTLYRKFGFEKLCKPEGATGHFGCDTWYAKVL